MPKVSAILGLGLFYLIGCTSKVVPKAESSILINDSLENEKSLHNLAPIDNQELMSFAPIDSVILSGKKIYLEPVSRAKFLSIESGSSPKKLPFDKQLIEIQNEEIIVRPLISQSITLRDSTDEDGDRQKSFEYFKTFQISKFTYAEFDVSYYEHSEKLLINLETGEQTYVYPDYIFSTDLTFLLSFDTEWMVYDVYNQRFKLFKISGPIIQLVAAIGTEDWVADDINIDNTGTLYLHRIKFQLPGGIDPETNEYTIKSTNDYVRIKMPEAELLNPTGLKIEFKATPFEPTQVESN